MTSFAQQLEALSTGTPTTGLRLAALTLYAMESTDREWMLGHLSEAERQPVSEMLDELEALGMPADMARKAPTQGHRWRDSDVELLQQVSRLVPSTVAAILSSEPDRLINRVLGLHEWPWKPAVVDQLHQGDRRASAVQSAMPARTIASDSCALSQVDRALLAALNARAIAVSVHCRAVANSTGGWWSRHLLRLRGLWGS